jgi:hypothetical protein
VFQFDGTAGQEVVGQIEGASRRYSYGSGELYSADGEHVAYIGFAPKGDGCCTYPERLPATGSYRLVMMEPLPAGTTLTLFDTEHAPKGLLDNDGWVDYPLDESCRSTADGGMQCSFSQGATPTTMVARSREVTATTSP